MAVIYKKLGEIADISAGGTPKRSNPTYWKNGNIPWVKISDVKGKYLEKTEEFITEDGLNNSSAKLFKKGTLLYTIFATIGECTILNIDASTNQAIAGINVKSKRVLNEYLYYFLKSIKNTVVNTGRGVAQNNINLSILKNIIVPLPEIEVQKKIIHLLNKSNELVIKRKAQIEALDQLTKSVFLEMFGDSFTNDKNFPIKPLSDIASVGSSKRVFVKELVDEGIPFYRGTEIASLAIGENITPTLFITKEHYKSLKEASGVPKIGDLLLPSVCPDGRIWRVNDSKPFYFKDGRVLWVNFTNNDINTIYVQYALKDKLIRDYINIASGTTFAELKIFSLKKVKLMIPPLELQNKFASIVEKIELQKKSMKNSLQEMRNNYNSLLQKAFKGELFTDEKISNP